MRRLRRRVDHETKRLPETTEESHDAVAIPDVQGVVLVSTSERPFELLHAPLRGGLGSEEVRPHIVVDANDVHPQ